MNEAEAVILAQSIGRSEAAHDIARAALRSKASVAGVVLIAMSAAYLTGVVSGAYVMKKALEEKAAKDVTEKSKLSENQILGLENQADRLAEARDGDVTTLKDQIDDTVSSMRYVAKTLREGK